MSGGFGYRSWHTTVPPEGQQWPERDEFSALSDRAAAEHLLPLRSRGPLKPGEIAVISVVRNEALRLPLFFAHYKKLGVTRFLIVDNASTDSTPDILLAEPLADIFHTEASYQDTCSGIYWFNGLARAYCIGHWIVMADADELLIYDGMDRHNLGDLTRWLELRAQDRLFAPMIDIYPHGVIGETGLSIAENLERNSFFDAAGYALQKRPCGWLATGGPRHRLFSKNTLLNGEWTSKYPLLRMGPETAICNAHFFWPRDEGRAGPFGALLHLKFMDDFVEKSERAVREGQYYQDSEKYRAINEALVAQPRQIAFTSRSASYSGPQDLVAHKLLLPIEWERDETLPFLRTLGDIDYRIWSGVGRPATISEGEREEFEDFSMRSFHEHLTIVRSHGRLADGEIGLICVLRNEVERLALFFDHYKRLGVSRFFMIDNGSDDGSRELLLTEPSADVFHAGAPFSQGGAGLYWAHAIARHFGEGNWLIRPDADELFVYDGMEEHDLADFSRWLDRHGMDRVFAPMVDLYPSGAIGGTAHTLADLIEMDSWFDNDGYSLSKWPQGWRLVGGPRNRLFHRDDSHRNLMWKYPFFRMKPETVIYNHHWLWPNDDVTKGALGAMVHLKLMHDFIERSLRYEREGQHFNNSNAYRVINQKVKDMPEVVAFYEGSKRYRGPRSLLRHGMLMPIDWEGEVSALGGEET